MKTDLDQTGKQNMQSAVVGRETSLCKVLVTRIGFMQFESHESVLCSLIHVQDRL